MRIFTDQNNKVYQFMGRLVDLFILNVLFILTSLPVVTIGASCVALATVSIKLHQGTNEFVVTTYLRAWLSNFGRGTALFGVNLIAGTLLLGAYRLLPLLPLLGYLISVVGILTALFIFIPASLYSFAYAAYYDDGFWPTLRACLLVALIKWQNSLILVVGFVALVCLITFSFFGALLVGFGLITIGFSGLAVILAGIFRRSFQPFEGNRHQHQAKELQL